MIIEIVNKVRSGDFYGGGENIEIAKGKHQAVTNWSEFKRKIKRIYYSKKK